MSSDEAEELRERLILLERAIDNRASAYRRFFRLSKGPASILERLVAAGGATVPNDVLQWVAQRNDNAISGSLYQHIRKLRKKVGRDLIVSDFGYGYYLKEIAPILDAMPRSSFGSLCCANCPHAQQGEPSARSNSMRKEAPDA